MPSPTKNAVDRRFVNAIIHETKLIVDFTNAIIHETKLIVDFTNVELD